MEEVLEEITNLTKHGCQEFVITGIHVTSYGKDLGDVTLIDLLEEIAKIPEENPFGISGTWIYHKGYIGPPF